MSLPPKVKDYKLKPLQRFYRPYFSPFPNSYEIDYVHGGRFATINEKTSKLKIIIQYYLACININTKYLFMVPFSFSIDKRFNLMTTLNAVQQIKAKIEHDTPGATIQNIRGDADKTFGTIVQTEEEQLFDGLAEEHYVELGHKIYVANPFTTWLRDAKIDLFLTSSPYTNKSRVVDRAIRTIRDRLGENPNALVNPELVAKAVEVYNNTVHSAFNDEFTPKQVQNNPELEEYYIRQNMRLLKNVKELQREEGYFNYEPGDVLLIHLDESKTEKRMVRKRRVFNKIVVFSHYENGNVYCKRVSNDEDGIVVHNDYPIIIPIYYTRYIAPDINKLPEKYRQLIF
jgi:hypothetical protein